MAMRPTTPNFNFAQQARPSSPPATPTTATFSFNANKNANRRHGIANFSHQINTQELQTGIITPNGNGPPFSFSYNPFQALDLELSPRSSSPASSDHSSGSSSAQIDSPRPRSRSSSPSHSHHSEPKPHIRTRIISEGNFTLEEFDADDYDAFDSDTENIIRPSQYEDADSERARSTKGVSPNRELDPRILHGLRDLNTHCAQPSDDEVLDEREIWLEKMREEKRRRRRSSGSVQKRSLAQSIGSDTDEEDVLPLLDGQLTAGSSARRLRRKVAGERTSLIFDDPPERIEELEEPESCEEVVEVVEDERQGVDRELPYYYVQDMDVDSDED
jgi:hypothetical protein